MPVTSLFAHRKHRRPLARFTRAELSYLRSTAQIVRKAELGMHRTPSKNACIGALYASLGFRYQESIVVLCYCS